MSVMRSPQGHDMSVFMADAANTGRQAGHEPFHRAHTSGGNRSKKRDATDCPKQFFDCNTIENGKSFKPTLRLRNTAHISICLQRSIRPLGLKPPILPKDLKIGAVYHILFKL